jgi:hypothetical protein
LQFLSRPFVVGDRIDILTSGGTKFATGFVERVDPIYTVLRTDTGTPVTISNKVRLCCINAASVRLDVRHRSCGPLGTLHEGECGMAVLQDWSYHSQGIRYYAAATSSTMS